MKINNIPNEAQEQTAVFNWAAVMARKWPELRLLHHIPNGGSRNAREARNLKAQGVKPGIPDICLPVARKGYHGLYIEMKRRKGGRISEDQGTVLGLLREQGYCAWVCKGANDAIELITEYLSNANTTMQGLYRTEPGLPRQMRPVRHVPAGAGADSQGQVRRALRIHGGAPGDEAAQMAEEQNSPGKSILRRDRQ